MSDLDPPPPYARDPNIEKPQFDLDDLTWLGIDGEFDAEKALSDRGYEPEPPIRMIVRAIIAANPVDGLDPITRENDAVKALIGAPSTKMGRPRRDDYDLLLEIAREYRGPLWTAIRKASPKQRDAWDSKTKPILTNPSLTKIIGRAVDKLREGDAERSKLKKEIKMKFGEDWNFLMLIASSDAAYDRLDQIRQIRSVLKEMERLGIKSSTSALPLRLEK